MATSTETPKKNRFFFCWSGLFFSMAGLLLTANSSAGSAAFFAAGVVPLLFVLYRGYRLHRSGIMAVRKSRAARKVREQKSLTIRKDRAKMLATSAKPFPEVRDISDIMNDWNSSPANDRFGTNRIAASMADQDFSNPGQSTKRYSDD